MRYWHLFFLIVITTGIFYVILMWQTEAHEDIHKMIFDDYNISSRVIIYYNPITSIQQNHGSAGVTIPNQDQYWARCDETCKAEQNFNEIVGYNTDVIVFGMMMALIIIIFLIAFATLED